jgi:predicted metal-binding membrane protein
MWSKHRGALRLNRAFDQTMVRGSLIEAALRRDRIVVTSALAAVVVFAWGYILAGAGMGLHAMDGMLMARHASWTASYAAAVLLMWATMMAAMMLPSAAPMILLFGTIARRRQPAGAIPVNAGIFGAGYITVWAAFSMVAAALQFGLDQGALLSPMLNTTSRALAGAVLIGAGIYQWTPLKQACLRRCRSPIDFLVTEWREGRMGAFVMGLRHGSYCVGCCWVLMLLLFIGGIMNIGWLAGIAVFVLVEKLAPAGHWVGQVAGVVLVFWGVTIIST